MDICHENENYLACLDHLFTCLGKMLRMIRATPAALLTDNTGEMILEEAQAYIQKHQIWHELCNPYEHHQNPRAEAAIGNVSACALTILVSSCIPRCHWQQAIMYSAEIDNRMLPTEHNSAVTCFEALQGIKPDNSKLMPFRCLAYLH